MERAGLGTTILDAACEDRSGSVALEILLREDVDCMLGLYLPSKTDSNDCLVYLVGATA
jgi:hypothetical protein